MTVDKFGRRPLFLVSAGGMVASFVIWTICGAVYENSNSTNTSSGYAQLVFIWMFGIFYDIGFSGLLIGYALEILPFELRAKGMMIMNITVQAILALGNQTNKLAWDNLPNHWNFMLFYTVSPPLLSHQCVVLVYCNKLLTYQCSSGMLLNSFLCTLSMLRQKAQHLKKLRRSLTVRMLCRTSISIR